VVYNDHAGVPPFVVIWVNVRPRREIFSSMANWSPGLIAPPFVILIIPSPTPRHFFTASRSFGHLDLSYAQPAAH